MWTVIVAGFVLCAAVVASLPLVAYLIYTAPEGYEDENGFHYGRPDDEH